ncbi:glycoside hydrolase family 65 protein [Peredibacter sp. HCB2-198]|uniref:glycoside hydrolase family 65 protein n=1 Tax=Peredibacter sp. HCB2-198 TaxID=3383025 RepID=UPI0038B438BE
METWSIAYDEWDPKEERLREALCTLGNGYFATRGAAEENSAGEYHYPGTYLAGGFNRSLSKVGDRQVRNEDLVNWPNWIPITFRHIGEDWFDLSQVEIISYQQELNLKFGMLSRSVLFRDHQGRESLLNVDRLVSMHNQHVASIRWRLKAKNWSGKIEIKSWLDGGVNNSGVHRYRDLNCDHHSIRKFLEINEECFCMETMTHESEIVVAQAIRNRLFIDKSEVFPHECWKTERGIGHVYFVDCDEEKEIHLEKTMTLFHSRDRALSNPLYESQRLIGQLKDFAEIFDCHKKEWERLWNLCDIELSDNPRETKLLRFHIFHLMQTVSLHNIDIDAGVPSRGLHGEAYRGHIFWDEVYIFPFLNVRIPQLTRSLLLYRYRRLDEARLNALVDGHPGALYPWQSGSNGEEESQLMHLNPVSGKWIPDSTYLQRHINTIIIYNIWKYIQTTNDTEFLSFFGIEMMLEICRYWASKMTYNINRDRYDIKGIVGPDEFHTAYPGSSELGINNNAYTNFMVSWCLRTTVEMFRTLPVNRRRDMLNSLALPNDELESWLEKSRKLYIPIRQDGIIEQFEGFEKLKNLNWDHYKSKYGNIQRIDRILEAEGDDANNYKLNKQCDVLMIYYLFLPDELQKNYEWLGYHFDPDSIVKNIQYHLSLSSNGSTLSRVVHSWILSRYDLDLSWHWFQRALESDISDIQGGTTQEGIHLGAMAGTVDLVQRCFTGIEVRDDVIWLLPHIPSKISSMNLRVRFRGHSILIQFKRNECKVKIERSWMIPGKIGFQGNVHEFNEGDEFTFVFSTHQQKFFTDKISSASL